MATLPRKLKPLPKLGGLVQAPRPEPLRHPPVKPTGPEIYRLQKKPTRLGVGPGKPPAGFVTVHSSATEWWIYWALAKVTNSPKNPRVGPYVGGENWTYQKAVDGGRRARGGQVIDFVVNHNGKFIGLRVQTERYHLTGGSGRYFQDFFLKTHIKAVDDVIDLFDSDFISDETGQAACVVVARALAGRQNVDPVRAGTYRRVR